jgi:AcrR family transcriptional regulator
MRFGYEGASTNEIARLAHVSKRDLYAHFPNKRAMLEGCVAARVERMRAPRDLPVPDTEAALRATLAAYGMAMLRELSRPEVLATFRLAVANAETAPDVGQTIDRFGRTEVLGDLVALLQAVCANGLLRGDPAQIADVFHALMMQRGVMVRMLMRVAEPPDEADLRARAELAVSVVWRLYGAAKT